MLAELIKPMPCKDRRILGQIIEDNVKKLFLAYRDGFVLPVYESMDTFERKWWISQMSTIKSMWGTFRGMYRGVIGGQVPVAAGCTSANDTSLYATTRTEDTGSKNATNTTWFAGRVTIAATSTITGFIIRGYDDSSDTATLYAELWTGDATDPTDTSAAGLIVGTTCSLANPDNTVYDAELLLVTPKTGIASGTYWVVVRASAAQWRQSYDSSEAGENFCRSTDSGATWPSCYPNQSMAVTVLGCVE